jgi:hypothetical protein
MPTITDKKFYLGPKFGTLFIKKWITISELLHLFHTGFTPPPNVEIKTRLELCYDTRTFNMLDGIHPFPPKPKT